MTDIDIRPASAHRSGHTADKRVLLTLAVVYLVGFGAMMATGSQREPDSDPTKIIADSTTSIDAVRIQVYFLMAVCAVVVFLGAGIRSVLAQHGRRWTTDAAFAGFLLLAVTYAGFGVGALMLQHAVDSGDPALVASANLFDTTNFLPAMAAMACIYLGVGVAAVTTDALPGWLGWVSVVLGIMAPLGPAAFAPFMLLPVWVVVVVACLRSPR